MLYPHQKNMTAVSSTGINIAVDYRFLISVAQPSMPSPFVPTGIGSLTPSIPLVLLRKGLLLIPPALALSCGRRPSIGIRKSAILSASSLLKWYFSRRTSGSAQWRKRWIFRRSPLREKISWDHLPVMQSDLGNGPRSSMICAMWSSSLPYLVPD